MIKLDPIEDIEYLRYNWKQLETEEFFEIPRRVQESAWAEGNNQPDAPSVVNPYSLGNG